MSKPKRNLASTGARQPTSSASVKRLDGVAHWPKSLDRLIWLLLRAGIEPKEIVDATARTLKARRRTPVLAMPAVEVLEYVRVLTFWRNEPQFLDANGRPLPLVAGGKPVSFKTLVRKALPRADARDVFTVLQRHRLVSRARNGRITMLGDAFLPRTAERAQFFAYTLAAIEGIIDTCYINLTARKPAHSVGLLQRTAVAERFDLKHLPAYDSFLRKQAGAFLLKQDAWLKRHEVQPTTRSSRAANVGVGIFGFRAR
jgi:hypothetical protein